MRSFFSVLALSIVLSLSVFAQNTSQILTSTQWRYDADQLAAAFQAQFGGMDEGSMSAEQRAAKEQAENQMNVMKDIRLHFQANNQLSIRYYGSEQGTMQWSVSGNTLMMSQQGQTQSFDLLSVSANELHMREQQTGEESYLLAEGYSRPSASAGDPKTGGAYKGKTISYSGAPIVNAFVVYQGDKLIIQNGQKATICECQVQERDGYEAGDCIGEPFENNRQGFYIKDDKGNIIIAYANRSTTSLKKIALFSVDEHNLQKHENSAAYQQMIQTLAEWYGVRP
ncbi:MAG: hypothetical protein ACFCUI_08515 [Bernardetiaceae bacterium]